MELDTVHTAQAEIKMELDAAHAAQAEMKMELDAAHAAEAELRKSAAEDNLRKCAMNELVASVSTVCTDIPCVCTLFHCTVQI